MLVCHTMLVRCCWRDTSESPSNKRLLSCSSMRCLWTGGVGSEVCRTETDLITNSDDNWARGWTSGTIRHLNAVRRTDVQNSGQLNKHWSYHLSVVLIYQQRFDGSYSKAFKQLAKAENTGILTCKIQKGKYMFYPQKSVLSVRNITNKTLSCFYGIKIRKHNKR